MFEKIFDVFRLHATITPQRLYNVSKNVPPLTCDNLDIHDPITTIFGRS